MSGQGVSRRQFLQISGMSLAAIGLAACAPAAPQPSGEAGGAAPAGEVVEISFMGWGGVGEDEGVKAAIEVFEEEQPNIKVIWMHTPENYSEKFLSNVAAGTPADTGFIYSTDYFTFIRDGLLLDITDYMEMDPLLGREDYFIQPQESERCTVEGRWYGIGRAGWRLTSTTTPISLKRRASSRRATTRMRPGPGTISSKWRVRSPKTLTATTPATPVLTSRMSRKLGRSLGLFE